MTPGEQSQALYDVSTRRLSRGKAAVHGGRPKAIQLSPEQRKESKIERLERQLQRARKGHELADKHRCYLEDKVFLLERELAILRRRAAA